MSDSLSTGTDTTLTRGTTLTPSSDLPLILGRGQQQDPLRSHVQVLPELPSHRYKYSVWHDISSTDVKGDQLKAPRVRCGPQEIEKLFYRLRNDDNMLIHHTKRGRERKDYRHKMENWENAECCNLSYQELGQAYQKAHFVQVLKRLFRVVELNLLEDNLTDLHGVSFPVVFQMLPQLKVLDDVKRQDSDDDFDLDQNETTSTCVVS
ncbi:hypothetical protein NP493_312g07005 [Ridgeia piscesae]|uniref:Uncharacterized protein n=1 Tax=Ridgeia piscesae TaxID=27915 RepID=A0AAD9NW32_RIDPI|nr:hypothetical protein NP493_312g07005 [Ridgeia piscesae]